MTGNAELLNFIYQNSQMGVDTINQLLDIVEDKNFKEYLKNQLIGYRDFHKKSKDMLNENGFDEKGIGTFDKLKAYMMINMKTLSDKSSSHVAEMMIIGSNMGIIDSIKKQRRYKNAEKNILKLMLDLQIFEENNAEKLKTFL